MNSLLMAYEGVSQFYERTWGLILTDVICSHEMWPLDTRDNGASYPGHRIYFLGRDNGWMD